MKATFLPLAALLSASAATAAAPEPAAAPTGAEAAARQELARIAALDDAGFRERFSGSPIKRIGRDRFVRNVLYAIGNSGVPALRPVAQGLCEDPDTTVADAARWAVGRLDDAANGMDRG